MARRPTGSKQDLVARVFRARDRVAPGLIHTDGETHEAGARVEVVVQPRSLRMLIPAASGAVAPVCSAAPARFALQLP